MPTRRHILSITATATAGAALLSACSGDDQPAPSPSTTPDKASNSKLQGLAAAIQADDPLVRLELQEGSDATKMTEAVSGAEVTPQGTTWWPNDGLTKPAPAAVGRSWYAGDGDQESWVEIDAKPLADIAKTGMTMEMWWLPARLTWRQTFAHATSAADTNGWRFGPNQDGTALAFDGFGQTGAELACPKLDDGQWHHIVMAIGADGAVHGWVDGKKLSGAGKVGAFKGAPQKLVLGRDLGQGSSLTGNISHFAVYPGVLTDERVTAHHEASVAAVNPVDRGTEVWFGGPAAYYKGFTNADWFADDSRFPIAEWWMNCETPEQFTEELNYVDGAVVIDPKNTPENARQAGVWVVRGVDGDMTGTPGAETVGWLPADEPDMDDTREKELPANIKKVQPGYLSYINYGTGVTLGMWDRYRVRKLVPDDGVDVVSADLYSYCVTPQLVDVVAQWWKIKPEQVRRAIHHGTVVERMRAFLTSPKPVWGVVAAGHANRVLQENEGWGSVPSADEMEGSMWACIIGGASGILVFPQCFPDGKPAPKWNKNTQYKVGDTVHVGNDKYTFWYARTEPEKGKAPNEHDDDTWLSWRPDAYGLRNTENYAKGVPERIAAVKKQLGELAKVLNSRSTSVAVADEIYARGWLEAPDGYCYLVAMQQLEHEQGEYTMQLPAVPEAAQVEVYGEDRTLPVTDGSFTDRFEAEWSHHVYRWKA